MWKIKTFKSLEAMRRWVQRNSKKYTINSSTVGGFAVEYKVKGAKQ